jgi:carboxymethylenebutenolidase
MTDVSFETPHHTLNGYLAKPEGPGPWPGVVVIHDVFGMTPVAREHGDWLAEAGLLALVPNLYSWGGTFRCLRATMASVSAGKGVAFDDIDAARQYLTDRPDCTGKIGVIGFCMGGGFAILTASGHGFSVSSPNYGQVPNDIESIMTGACPVIASFGAKDKTLKGAADKLEQTLTKLGIEHNVKEYPNSGHAFMEDYKKGTLAWLVCRLFGMRFNEKDAADARERITAFFKQHLA